MSKNKEADSPESNDKNIKSGTNSYSDYCNNNKSSRASLSSENIEQIIQSGIEITKNIQFSLSQNNSETITNNTTNNTTNTTSNDSSSSNTSSTNTSESVNQLSTLLQNLNNVKEQIAKLNLDPTQRVYFDYCVNPLLTILYELTASSATLATAINILTTSPVVHPKKPQLKDSIHLVYDINEQCEDVYKELKKRIDAMLGK